MNELESVIADIEVAFAAFGPDTTLDVVRADLDALFGNDTPDPLCTHETFAIGAASAELITAPGAGRTGGVILYLHGGGYAVCSVHSHRDLCERLSHASGSAVLALEYRLAPENPFPAALEDAVAAYQWLLERNHPAGSLAIAGDSAGGGLVLATLLALKERRIAQPGCAAVLSPWVDLELSGKTMKSKAGEDPIVHEDALNTWIACYVPDGDVKNPLVSPLFGDFTGVAPLLVQVGEREALLDDARRIVEVARKAGVEVEYQYFPGQIHVFQVFGYRLAEAREAIAAIGSFVRRHTITTGTQTA